MRILQVNKRHWDHVGGIEKVVKDVAEVFSNLGYENSVLAVNEECKTDKLKLDQTFILKASQLFVFLSMPVSISFFVWFRRLVKIHDVIILHHPFPLAFLAYLMFGQHKPMVVWYHSDIVRQKTLAWVIRGILNSVLNYSKAIIVSDESVFETSVLLAPFKSKITVIPYATSVVRKTDNYDSLLKTLQKPLILAVGRLVYYKGYEYLIEAMKGVPATLLIIGSGPLRESLSRQIQSLELSNIEIIDPVEDLSDYYFAADIFVLPSIEISEAFGLVQIEAMSAGIPVVNTNLPTAVPRVSQHNSTGLTVPPKDAIALNRALIELINNPALRTQFGISGKVRVNEFYSYEAFRKNLSLLINLLRRE